MSTDGQRRKRRNKRLGNWRLVRYCDDFVLMVFGERHHAEALHMEVSAVLATLGLRLAPEKTQVVHIVLLTELTTEFQQAVDGAGRVPANLPA